MGETGLEQSIKLRGDAFVDFYGSRWRNLQESRWDVFVDFVQREWELVEEFIKSSGGMRLRICLQVCEKEFLIA